VPAWVAVTEQLPAASKLRVEPVTEQIPAEVVVNATTAPLEAEAVSAIVLLLILEFKGGLNVIV